MQLSIKLKYFEYLRLYKLDYQILLVQNNIKNILLYYLSHYYNLIHYPNKPWNYLNKIKFPVMISISPIL